MVKRSIYQCIVMIIISKRVTYSLLQAFLTTVKVVSLCVVLYTLNIVFICIIDLYVGLIFISTLCPIVISQFKYILVFKNMTD